MTSEQPRLDGGGTLPQDVQVALRRQARLLDARVAASGLYRHEPAELRTAIDVYARLWDELGVTADFGSLTTDESRNVVRRVRLADGGDAVLKVSGHVREPGEGDVLAAWHARVLPCVEPLEWGYLRAVGGSPATYLLTRLCDGTPLPSPQPSASLRARQAVAERLTAFIEPFHRSGARVPRTRSWSDRLSLHLHWTLPLVHQRGLPLPPDWDAVLELLSSQGDVVVHGDPAGGNVIVDGGGAMLLLDPPGALRALPEADVGQICSQVGGVQHVEAVVDAACDAHRRLDPAAVAAFAGLNFLTWAGYFLVAHPNPDALETEEDNGGADHAGRYLAVADRLLTDARRGLLRRAP